MHMMTTECRSNMYAHFLFHFWKDSGNDGEREEILQAYNASQQALEQSASKISVGISFLVL